MDAIIANSMIWGAVLYMIIAIIRQIRRDHSQRP